MSELDDSLEDEGADILRKNFFNDLFQQEMVEGGIVVEYFRQQAEMPWDELPETSKENFRDIARAWNRTLIYEIERKKEVSETENGSKYED